MKEEDNPSEKVAIDEEELNGIETWYMKFKI